MEYTFFFRLPTHVLVVIIFFTIAFFNWLGYRCRKWQIEKHPMQIRQAIGSVEGSMLGLMSLLMGFTFSVALSKLEERRHLVVEEANTICTAILRCDMYPDSIRSHLRLNLKKYVEARISYYQAGQDEQKIMEEINKAEVISGGIWKDIALYSNDPNFRIRSQQMIPVLNDMIGIVTTRDATRSSRVPPLILWTLLVLVFIAAFLLGSEYNGHKRNTGLLIGYALVMTVTLNLINEINHPRQGLINLDEVEKKMENLRKLLI